MALKITNSFFVKVAVKKEQFPEFGIPEFAFFGRSNAGKSSLINMLVNRKNLVKTGSRPGMTREINFFLINKPQGADFKEDHLTVKKNRETFVLTDLPGYGYAKLSGKKTIQIDEMLYQYCSDRQDLKILFFLMDMRRPPSETEKNSIDFFQKLGIETVIVGTKSDKLNKTEQIKAKKEWAHFFTVSEENIIVTSSPKKIGKEPILSMIERRCKEK